MLKVVFSLTPAFSDWNILGWWGRQWLYKCCMSSLANLDKYIWQLRQIHLANTSRNLGLVRKGRFCTMLHVTVGHYRHSRQATSHPKAMRQPHPIILSKSFFIIQHLFMTVWRNQTTTIGNLRLFTAESLLHHPLSCSYWPTCLVIWQ